MDDMTRQITVWILWISAIICGISLVCAAFYSIRAQIIRDQAEERKEKSERLKAKAAKLKRLPSTLFSEDSAK